MDIKEIMEQMTLEEKAEVCSGGDFWHTRAFERLGVPAVMMTDGPSGLRKQGEGGDHLGMLESVPAVCFPSSAAVASSFDTALAGELGAELGEECQAEDVALLLGPGLGGTAQSAARATETRTLVQQLLPGFVGAAVLDADGLNATAQLLAEGKPFPHPAGELVVTPHPGEMARLTGLSAAALATDREGIALRYAKAWNAVVVLKGARTVVASPDGRVCVNPTGNPGLARGGSGDVLAGMLAALLACGLPAYQAAACAVYLHGAAADRAAAKRGEYGMLPHDILPELGALFAENQR